MTKPTNLTTEVQEELFKMTVSRIGDNPFVKCLMSPSPIVLDGFLSSILDWISFYFVGEAMVLFCLVLPILFFFSATGKQKKMQLLYGRARLALIQFLFTCAFGMLASTCLGWVTNQKGPCVYAYGSNLLFLGARFQLPSANLVTAIVMVAVLFNLGKSVRSGIDAVKYAKTVKEFCSSFFIKIFSLIVGLLFFVIEVIYGKANILQGIFSVCFAIIVQQLVTILPIAVSFGACGVLCLIGMFLVGFTPRPAIVGWVYDEVWAFVFSGLRYSVYCTYMIVFFIRSRPDVTWMSRFSDYLEDPEVLQDAAEAEIGEIERSEGVAVDFKKLLMNDLRDTGIATLINIAMYVMGNLLIDFVPAKG